MGDSVTTGFILASHTVEVAAGGKERVWDKQAKKVSEPRLIDLDEMLEKLTLCLLVWRTTIWIDGRDGFPFPETEEKELFWDTPSLPKQYN